MAFPFGEEITKYGIPICVVDVENTVIDTGDGKVDMSPFHADNKLVSVGYKFIIYGYNDTVDTISNYLCFGHNKEPHTYDGPAILQKAINDAELLVGHNLKHDIQWLEENGFDLSKPFIYDTMLTEYVLDRSEQKHGLSLAEVCRARGLGDKPDTIEQYLKKGISIADIPWIELRDRGEADVDLTTALLVEQIKELGVNFDKLLSYYKWDKLDADVDKIKNELEKEQRKSNTNNSSNERNVFGPIGDRA